MSLFQANSLFPFIVPLLLKTAVVVVLLATTVRGAATATTTTVVAALLAIVATTLVVVGPAAGVVHVVALECRRQVFDGTQLIQGQLALRDDLQVGFDDVVADKMLLVPGAVSQLHVRGNGGYEAIALGAWLHFQGATNQALYVVAIVAKPWLGSGVIDLIRFPVVVRFRRCNAIGWRYAQVVVGDFKNVAPKFDAVIFQVPVLRVHHHHHVDDFLYNLLAGAIIRYFFGVKYHVLYISPILGDD